MIGRSIWIGSNCLSGTRPLKSLYPRRGRFAFGRSGICFESWIAVSMAAYRLQAGSLDTGWSLSELSLWASEVTGCKELVHRGARLRKSGALVNITGVAASLSSKNLLAKLRINLVFWFATGLNWFACFCFEKWAESHLQTIETFFNLNYTTALQRQQLSHTIHLCRRNSLDASFIEIFR